MSITDTFTKTTPRKVLTDLIQTLKDGQEGFRTASEDLDDSQLKTLFSQFSLQRSKFAGDLQAELTALGEGDAKESTVAGALHRGWINLKAALTSKDRHAVLSEAERGEDVAVKAYKDALESEHLPANLRTIISAQAVEVKKAHDTVKALRDEAKK